MDEAAGSRDGQHSPTGDRRGPAFDHLRCRRRRPERSLDRFSDGRHGGDDPAQLYYSSGTTGQAKGILHAHRYFPAHNEFELCHDVRADDVIISAGYRIGPFEVESAIVELPEVVEAAAVSSPDSKRGHVVKAFVRLGAGVEADDALVERIQKHVRERYAAYAYPREVEFVAELPKTLTGKIRRIELRRAEEERKEGAGSQ